MDWTTAFAVVALSAIGAAFGTFLKEYFASRARREGEIDAVKRNLDEVLRQLRESTKTTERTRTAVAARLEHDRNMFARYEDILPENLLTKSLDGDLYNKRTTALFTRQLRDLTALGASEAGRFMDESVEREFSVFVDKASNLREFIAQHFFKIEPKSHSSEWHDDLPLVLYPDLKYEDPDHWEEMGRELDRICEGVGDTYKAYRRAVKEHLAL